MIFFIQSLPATLSRSLAEFRFAFLVEWAQTFIVVLTSECPNSSCTSFGAAPFERRLLVQVCSNWWKWKFTKPSSLFATDRQAMLSVLGSSRHSVRSQADKGHFLVICRDFFGSVWMIIFIIHSVFVLYFLVEIAMVKFTILHPAFKLFLYVFKWTFYLSFFTRPVAWACIQLKTVIQIL